MKETKTFLIILAIVVFFFVLNKLAKANSKNSNNTSPNGSNCSDPDFSVHVNIAGKDCAGSVVDEKRLLKLGDYGCDVLLLQQRLNGIDNSDILAPTGKFECNTLEKLRKVKGVGQIRLIDFYPNEQTGFNEFEATKVYSGQDINKERY